MVVDGGLATIGEGEVDGRLAALPEGLMKQLAARGRQRNSHHAQPQSAHLQGAGNFSWEQAKEAQTWAVEG